MKRNLFLLIAGIVQIGLLSGCATTYYAGPNPADRSLGGKVAQEYRAEDTYQLGSNYYQYEGSYTQAPVYVVNGTNPNQYETYYHGTSPIVSTKLDGTEMAMRGVNRAGMAGRPGLAGRRAIRGMSPYAGSDPYLNNPYAGNTVTRGPRDFLMTNPPNIGP